MTPEPIIISEISPGRVLSVCPRCEFTFSVIRSRNQTFCSRYCANEYRKEHRGVSSRNSAVEMDVAAVSPYASYRIKRTVWDKKLQKWCFVLEHQGMSFSSKVPISQYVLESKLGRLLRDGEVVSFIDGNSKSLDPDNFILGFCS